MSAGGKRVSSESETAYNYRLDPGGAFVRHSCAPLLPGVCEHFQYPFCMAASEPEEIQWPYSGPVGDRCPLERYEFPEEDVGANGRSPLQG